MVGDGVVIWNSLKESASFSLDTPNSSRGCLIREEQRMPGFQEKPGCGRNSQQAYGAAKLPSWLPLLWVMSLFRSWQSVWLLKEARCVDGGYPGVHTVPSLSFPPYCCFPVTSVCVFQRLERLLSISFTRFTNPESFPPFLRKLRYLNKTPDLVAIKLFPVLWLKNWAGRAEASVERRFSTKISVKEADKLFHQIQ